MFTQSRQSAINRQVRKSLILSGFSSCLYYCTVPCCRNQKCPLFASFHQIPQADYKGGLHRIRFQSVQLKIQRAALLNCVPGDLTLFS